CVSSSVRVLTISILFPYATLFRSRSPEEKSKLKAAILKIDGVTKVIFQDTYPSEVTVHTDQVVHVNEIQEKASELDFHVIAKGRSEEHTSELQSRETLVCRLLLEK